MLSQKLQDDLITAYQKVYEEKRGHAAGSDDTEKQASQLASDVRYKAKGKVPAGASEEEKRKIFLQILASSPAPNVVKAMAKDKLLGEEVVAEDKKMARQSSDDLEKALDKLSKMDQSSPANSFMKKRIEKEIKKRKTMKEGSSYGITRGSGKPSGPMAAFGKKDEDEKKEKKEKKAPRKQKGAMAYDGPNKERSEAADRVLAKTKKKREEKKKMKEEYVSEKMMAKKLMRKPVDPVNVATKAAGVAGAAGVGMAYKKTNESAGETIGEMKEKSKPKNLKDMSKGAEQKAPVDYRTLAQSYKPVGNIFNEKKLDAVGAEDKDIDNDGDHDSTDKYLLKRRKAIGKAIAKKRGKVKEGFSAWRIDLDFNEQVKK